MKKIILICSALFWVMIIEALPASFTGKNEVKLYNSLTDLSTRRTVVHQIQVFKTTSKLDANFLGDVGSIDIVVYNDSGNIVYQDNVDTSAVHQLSIDISGWEQGSYEIRLIDADDHFMYGEFDVE